jgi:hypothetical protein
MKINSKKKNFDGFIEIDFQNQSKNNSNNKKKHKENSKKKISKNCNNINKEKLNTNIPNDNDPFMEHADHQGEIYSSSLFEKKF